jgi:hypothetical protein
MHRTALHRIIALPLAAILLTLMLSAVAAAQDAPPLDPIPTPTGTSTALRPDAAAPLRPDAAPLPDPTSTGAAPLRPDAVAGATAGSFAVYLPLVVRPGAVPAGQPPVGTGVHSPAQRGTRPPRAAPPPRAPAPHPRRPPPRV